jgi:hypothetical protein
MMGRQRSYVLGLGLGLCLLSVRGVSAQTVNACSFPGVNAGLQIAAALASLPAAGGTIVCKAPPRMSTSL